jgi:eukaryotic-like serine/threonine-protein kinase
MAICPRCRTPIDELLAPCPNGDGYFAVDDDEVAAYPTDTILGRKVAGRFLVTSVLGRGAMGFVYKAVQDQVDRLVALKIFRPETFLAPSSGDQSVQSVREAAQQRFVQEARVLGRLAHPNCVTLYDFGVSEREDFLYIAMEHVGGMSLRRAMKRGLKLDGIAEIIRQVLFALREAHSMGIVHRDLKPENVMLTVRPATQEQVVKVLDFGIAKLLEGGGAKTTAGLLFGTPAYMSPEQCRGDLDIGPQADVYALGCLLYEMCAGHLPYQSNSPYDMVRLHQEAPIPILIPRSGVTVPQSLHRFIERCLAKDPAERYADAGMALLAFDEAIADDDGQGKASVSSGGGRKKQESGARKKVVVPRNRVSGAELNPLAPAQGLVVEEAAPTARGPRVQQQVSRALGDLSVDAIQDVDTLTGSSTQKSPIEKLDVVGEDSRSALFAIGGLVVVSVICLVLFYFFYRSTLGG